MRCNSGRAMKLRVVVGGMGVMGVMGGLGASGASAQHATSVVSYTPGTGTNPAFNSPASALGEPSRFTPGQFPGAVTPFNPAFRGDQLVQVGRGGSLVLAFDRPIVNSPSNPFGIDLIVFGNAFLGDSDFPNGTSNGIVSAEGGDVDVSADGQTWFRVATNAADGLYPTLGFADLAGPYQETPGSVPTDFTMPVDPSVQLSAGLSFAQIVALYNGSGGGLGVDIASSGLSVVNFVRISVASDATFVPEIDGVAIVPTPGTLGVLLLAAVPGLRRRRTS